MTAYEQIRKALRETRFYEDWLESQDDGFWPLWLKKLWRRLFARQEWAAPPWAFPPLAKQAEDSAEKRPAEKRPHVIYFSEKQEKEMALRHAISRARDVLEMDNILKMSFGQVLSAAHEIIMRKSDLSVERLKKDLLAKGHYARRAAALAETEAAKNKCLAISERLNEIHIGLCFVQKKAFQPQPGGRGKKTSSAEEPDYWRQKKERHYLKGIETEDQLKAATQALRERDRPLSLYGLSELRKHHEMKARIDAARARRPTAAETRSLKHIKIHHLPMAKLAGKIKPGSVDILLTDPPYQKGDQKLFEDLGAFAGKVLKPGGSLLCMAGNMYLPVWINSVLKEKALKWHFLIHYAFDGPTARLFARSVCVGAKPVLWFVKGQYKGKWINNSVRREGSFDQKYHKWEQSVEGMHAIWKKFQPAGQLVCDPFVGGGASALAAYHEGCHFIGGDIDKAAADTTQGRLYEAAAKYDKTQLIWK